jgi:hypothetical protein
MAKNTGNQSFRAGFFSTVTTADHAVRRLLAAGFSRDEIAVICPDQFKDQFSPDVPAAQGAGENAVATVAMGSVVGVMMGGIALAATAIATGGIGLIPAATVLLGGGAFAGGFGSLIMADGYDNGVGVYSEQAIQLGKIVVGVEIAGEDSGARLDQAARILEEAGADFLPPKEPTPAQDARRREKVTSDGI